MILNDIDNPLPLPDEIRILAIKGLWPGVGGATNRAIQGLIDWAEFEKLIPGERELLLKTPPFGTVSKAIRLGSGYWAMPEVVVDQIDPENTVAIGGLGHGSDIVLALDYRNSKSNPSLIRLDWVEVNPRENNRWVCVSSSFGEFCRLIGLL